MSGSRLVVTDASGEECDNCSEKIDVGAEILINCPHCNEHHRLHARCLSEYGVNKLGGRDAFDTLVRVAVASQN